LTFSPYSLFSLCYPQEWRHSELPRSRPLSAWNFELSLMSFSSCTSIWYWAPCSWRRFQLFSWFSLGQYQQAGSMKQRETAPKSWPLEVLRLLWFPASW
jgi:hypothetical protein